MEKARKTRIGPWGACPLAILTDPAVTPTMIKVYIALSSYQGTSEKCWPSREKIASVTGLTAANVSRATTELVRSGWIEREGRQATNQTNVYHVCHDVAEAEEAIEEEEPGAEIRHHPSAEIRHHPSAENRHIHLYTTTKETTLGEKGGVGSKKQAREVIDYLNAKTGKRFRYVDAHIKKINARLDEGATVQDCKTVIDKKCRDWKEDPRMEKYLRPETLFAPSKFDGYLNEGEGKAKIQEARTMFDDWEDMNG